jgi:hypothetical protein
MYVAVANPKAGASRIVTRTISPGHMIRALSVEPGLSFRCWRLPNIVLQGTDFVATHITFTRLLL